jgi:N-acyl-D-amino-acid deacylase
MRLVRHHWIATLLAVLGLAACGGGGSDSSSPNVVQGTGVERIDTAMTGVMRQYAPPGIAVAVVRGGRLVFAEAWGTADLAGSEPLRPDHRFRVASVSKPITAIALMRAVEDGLLDLDVPAFEVLADYLPEDGADPRLDGVTVRRLLRHTGGWDLWGYPNGPLFRHAEIAAALGVALPVSSDDLVRWIARQPLAFDPGSQFAYTNVGYVVLARVLEASTGFRYEDFVRRFALEPAGVTDGRLGGVRREDRLPDEVEYQSFRNNIWLSVYDGRTVADEPAYGGINLVGFDASSAWVVSAVDLARLAAATDGDPAYPDVISAESVQAMTTPGTPPGYPAIGLSWWLGLNGLGQAVSWNHSGGMPGTTSYLTRLPSGVIVAVITNTARDQAFNDALISGLVQAVNGIRDWPNVDLFPQYQRGQ